jgi:hypothetical protein
MLLSEPLVLGWQSLSVFSELDVVVNWQRWTVAEMPKDSIKYQLS